MRTPAQPKLGDRSSGLLLHPTSLPGPNGSGDLGEGAWDFLEFLEEAGQAWWQMLPVGPPGYGNCPYMAESAFAVDPHLIDLQELFGRLGLSPEAGLPAVGKKEAGRIRFEAAASYRDAGLRKASTAFFADAGAEERSEFERFVEAEGTWLRDFALFRALKEATGTSWTAWEPALRHRDAEAVARAYEDLREPVRHHAYLQYEAARQWRGLRERSAKKGVSLIGDIPIFVAHESADVWANPEVFSLDEQGQPTVVAGVPPDYFSATGQRWGHPLYRWDVLRERGYGWWMARFRRTLALFDVVRIDHFIGFVRYWEIPASSETAVNGRWVQGPGEEFFHRLREELGRIPVIAEDLGTVTEEVVSLREKFRMPGMRVLQFAFGGDARTNDHLPHLHTRPNVVYTGTHDNDTTVGWYRDLRKRAGLNGNGRSGEGADTADRAAGPAPGKGEAEARRAARREHEFLLSYLGTKGKDVHWDMIRLAHGSVADIAMIPAQDLLGVGSEARMNMPSAATGNWAWRMPEGALTPAIAARLRSLTETYGRLLPREA